MGIEFKSFSEARSEKNLHLSEIKEAIKASTRSDLDSLKAKVSQELIKTLWSKEGLVIKWNAWKDQLGYIWALTAHGNKITWTNRSEADLIYAWDIIRIEEKNWKKVLTKTKKSNWKKVLVWKVEGFDKPSEPNSVVVQDDKVNDWKIANNNTNDDAALEVETPIDWWNSLDDQETDWDKIEITTEQIKQNILSSINSQFNAFKETINKLNTLIDIQTSSEKVSNKELLDINYNALIILLQKVKDSTDKDIVNKVSEIKLYLAKYYADEWKVENNNFKNYELSNKLAFDVLWEIQWVNPPPKAPDMWEIISSFKWTWVWTYIVTKLNEWETINDIFESKAVKDATEERWEELFDEYKDKLEKYLENIDENHREWLTENQIAVLDLLMDVNGAWWSVRNSTTDMLSLGWLDLVAIWAWIWTGFWTWGKIWWATGFLAGWVWAIPWAVIGAIWWAVTWWFVATNWMMINHWDNYYSEDYWKWLTELWINTAMFGFWWAVFKWARMIQWANWILSKKWVLALSAEALADVAIWVSSDMTRAWAYEMNIDLTDAIVNNLVWALLPFALNWKQIFSEFRQGLARESSEVQQRASILSKLWDRSWAKKLLNRLSEKVKKAKKKETWDNSVIYVNSKGNASDKLSDVENSKTQKNTWETPSKNIEWKKSNIEAWKPKIEWVNSEIKRLEEEIKEPFLFQYKTEVYTLNDKWKVINKKNWNEIAVVDPNNVMVRVREAAREYKARRKQLEKNLELLNEKKKLLEKVENIPKEIKEPFLFQDKTYKNFVYTLNDKWKVINKKNWNEIAVVDPNNVMVRVREAAREYKLKRKEFDRLINELQKIDESINKIPSNKKVNTHKEKPKHDKENRGIEPKSSTTEVVSEEVYRKFVKTWEVPENVLNSIAQKYIRRENLTPKEVAIYNDKVWEREKILQKEVKNDTLTNWNKDKPKEKTKSEGEWSQKLWDSKIKEKVISFRNNHFLESKFKKEFNRHDFKKDWIKTFENTNWEKIVIKYENKKYRVEDSNWQQFRDIDSNIWLSKSEILARIPEEFKVYTLLKKAIIEIESSKWNIVNLKWFAWRKLRIDEEWNLWKWNEKITRNPDEVREWLWNFENTKTILSKGIKPKEEKEILKKLKESSKLKEKRIIITDYAWNTIKDFLRIWYAQGAFTALLVGIELYNTDAKNWEERTFNALKTIVGTLIIWKIFKIWSIHYKVWKDGWLKVIDISKNVFKKVWLPVAIWGVAIWVLYSESDKMEENSKK